MQELGPPLLLGEGQRLLADARVDAVPLGELEEEDGEPVAGEGAEEVEERGAWRGLRGCGVLGVGGLWGGSDRW